MGYSLHKTGDEAVVDAYLGMAMELLRQAEEARALTGVFTLTRYYSDPGTGVTIRVVADKFGNPLISIDAPPTPGEPIQEEVRQRVLHCRLKITPMIGGIPPYEGDPSFVAFEPITNADADPIFVHFVYEVDAGGVVQDLSQFKFDIDGSLRDFDSEWTLDEISGEVERLLDCTRLRKVDADFKPIEIEDTDTPPWKPELVDTLLDPDETDLSKLGWLDKYEQNVAGTEDDYGLYFASDMEDKVFTSLPQVTAYGVKTPLNDFRIQAPFETYTAFGIPVKSAFIMSHGVESIRDNIPGDAPVASNACALQDRFEGGIVLLTPFTAIASDFRDIPQLGECVFKSDRDDSSVTIWGASYASAQYSIIPYLVETKDPVDSLLQFFTPAPDYDEKYPINDDPLYGATPENYMFHNMLGNWILCLLGGSEYTCRGIFNRYSHASNWMFLPFRNELWMPKLDDYWESSSALFSSPQEWRTSNPLANPWEPGGVFAALPNRMVLAIRNFFANTPDPLSKQMQRKRYDLEWTDEIISRSSYDNYPAMVNPATTHHRRLSTYTNVTAESSPPLTAQYLPTFVTEKGDFVHVALLSSIYAMASKGDFSGDEIRLSPRHEGSATLAAGATVITKRPWPNVIDLDWSYTNVYGAGISIDNYGRMVSQIAENDAIVEDEPDLDYWDHGWISYYLNEDLADYINTQYTVFDDQYRIDADTGEEVLVNNVNPEKLIIDAIYKAMEDEGYDKHDPIKNLEVDAILYERTMVREY